MKSIIYSACILTIYLFSASNANSQVDLTERFKLLIGDWEGTGEGFSGNNSTIKSSFNTIMDGRFLEVKNNSRFEATEKYPEGENHLDQGIISYDKNRNLYVFRQFHIEGYVNRYILNEDQSSDTSYIFESEQIENFPDGGQAKWTIFIHSPDHIETVFDVSFPGRDFACFGTNHLWRKK